MVRAAPPVRPARLRLGPGRQRDDPMRRAPRGNQDAAPNMIAHRGTALKVGFTGQTRSDRHRLEQGKTERTPAPSPAGSIPNGHPRDPPSGRAGRTESDGRPVSGPLRPGRDRADGIRILWSRTPFHRPGSLGASSVAAVQIPDNRHDQRQKQRNTDQRSSASPGHYGDVRVKHAAWRSVI